ncbi:hypothetical protein L195_g026821 [Trifolium pratense]|uniref:Secreted protein n=1 Tax=Trifolium pratense TaxID=57577 RepID=A0A2K3NKH2_TRIPR|nr:hypothetical protein L195_g026821 [Trifolium pratense]
MLLLLRIVFLLTTRQCALIFWPRWGLTLFPLVKFEVPPAELSSLLLVDALEFAFVRE